MAPQTWLFASGPLLKGVFVLILIAVLILNQPATAETHSQNSHALELAQGNTSSETSGSTLGSEHDHDQDHQEEHKEDPVDNKSPSESDSPDFTSADSLPAFRSDTSEAKGFQSLESGTQDSTAKPIKQSLGERKLTLGLWVGAAFYDFEGKKEFSARSDRLAASDSGSVVQRQDPVHLAFPLGLAVDIPVTHHWDATLRTQHYWYQQSELIKTSSGGTQEQTFSATGHWVGVGVRFLAPSELLTVKGQSGLQLGFQWLWGLGLDQLYGSEGDLPSRFSPAGIGYEMQIGYQRDYRKRFALSGGLSYLHTAIGGEGSWGDLFPGATGKSDWGFSGLQLVLNVTMQVGAIKPSVPSPSKSTAEIK
jgi:hypothetical protein